MGEEMWHEKQPDSKASFWRKGIRHKDTNSLWTFCVQECHPAVLLSHLCKACGIACCMPSLSQRRSCKERLCTCHWDHHMVHALCEGWLADKVKAACKLQDQLQLARWELPSGTQLRCILREHQYLRQSISWKMPDQLLINESSN